VTVAIKDTAFAKWLKSVPRETAMQHLFQCLVEGPGEDNMAWELWIDVHGDKGFNPVDLPIALGAMLDSLGGPQ
jgi:hypothetical protein